MPTAENTKIAYATQTASGYDFAFTYVGETDPNDSTKSAGTTISMTRRDALHYPTFLKNCAEGGGFSPTISAWQDAISKADRNA